MFLEKNEIRSTAHFFIVVSVQKHNIPSVHALLHPRALFLTLKMSQTSDGNCFICNVGFVVEVASACPLWVLL